MTILTSTIEYNRCKDHLARLLFCMAEIQWFQNVCARRGFGEHVRIGSTSISLPIQRTISLAESVWNNYLETLNLLKKVPEECLNDKLWLIFINFRCQNSSSHPYVTLSAIIGKCIGIPETACTSRLCERSLTSKYWKYVL